MTRSVARVRLLLVLACAFALFAPSLGNRFALDDRLVAMSVRDDGSANEMVGQLQPLTTYFTSNYWRGFLDQDILFRPVTVLSYALVYVAIGQHLGGEAGEARPQHALNVLLHLLAVWLVYRLARGVRMPRASALVAAVIFAVHAIHSEVVAGVVGRAELLGFAFGALAALAFLPAKTTRGWRAGRLVGSALALFLAMSAKESAVAWIPFLLVAVVVRELQGGANAGVGLGRLLAGHVGRWLAVAALPLAVFWVLRAAMIAGAGADAVAWGDALVRATPGATFGNAVVQWAYALRACLLPTHLAADWGPMVFAPVPSAAAPSALASLGALTLVLGVALVWWRRRPILFAAAATWFGHSFLVSNVPFRIGTDYAERLYYAPSLGAAFLGAWAASVWPRSRRWLGLALLGAWTAWNSWLLLQRNPVWRDNESLLRHEVTHQPRSARMHLSWAGQLEKRGELDAIPPHLETFLTMYPENAAAWSHLGTVHARLGRAAEALRCFQRAVAASDFKPSVRVAAAINLAMARALAGEIEAAKNALELALATDPAATVIRVPDLRRNLAAILPAPWLEDFVRRTQQAAARTQQATARTQGGLDRPR